MNNNSDPLFERYADMDFSDAKPISEIPALARLQAEQRVNTTQQRIAINFDSEIIDYFRATGKDWQARMNDALKEWIKEHAL